MLSPAHRLRAAHARRWLLLTLLLAVAVGAAAVAGLLAVEWFPSQTGNARAARVFACVLASMMVGVGLCSALWFLAWQLPRCRLLILPGLGALAALLLAAGWLGVIWLDPFWTWRWGYALLVISLLLVVAYAMAWPAELLAGRVTRLRGPAGIAVTVAAGYALLAFSTLANIPAARQVGLTVSAASLASLASLLGVMLVLPPRGAFVVLRGVGLTLIALAVPVGAASLLTQRPEDLDEPLLALALAVVGVLVSCLSLAVGTRWERIDPLTTADRLPRVLVRCPRCERTDLRPLGSTPCPGCGLGLTVAVQWPDCPRCGYSLTDCASTRCPECGTGLSSPSRA